MLDADYAIRMVMLAGMAIVDMNVIVSTKLLMIIHGLLFPVIAIVGGNNIESFPI